MTNKPFFPTSKLFWALHAGCWGTLYLFIVVMQALGGQGGVKMQAVGGLIYVILGAAGSLVYRFLFHALGWNNRSILKVTMASLVFVCLEGAFVGLLIVCYVYTLSLFAPDWMMTLSPQMPQKHYLLIVFIANSINITVFQAIWSAIYIAISTYRKSLKREVEALKLENSLKEAQLSILSSQLNPHFLFNALNNIRFMMRKDASQAETMLTHLSDLLRYALESSRAQKVSVARELETVEHYISLAQIQFNERLNYRQQVDENLLDALMPPMILQMLIENAVKHGMEQLKEGGELKLEISAGKDQLNIQVSNDIAEKKRKTENPGFGIGLSNIEKRLQLIYGDIASLESGMQNNTWVASLSLPLENAFKGRLTSQ